MAGLPVVAAQQWASYLGLSLRRGDGGRALCRRRLDAASSACQLLVVAETVVMDACFSSHEGCSTAGLRSLHMSVRGHGRRRQHRRRATLSDADVAVTTEMLSSQVAACTGRR